ncbi:hypothetical protein Glove_360g35 [Diversispora epigaea]|uniref:NELF-A N-terminal domain-containing protein n=1 Tax=Diversispora epigaea TaxID=1348612 RepID=A0A397HEC0_9GLOM|nr:hypothetical protein Glove_360g35 [Diversispora epigaea]
MVDRTTPEGIEAWLTQASMNPWTLPAVIGPELSKEILQHIYGHWGTYSNNIKLGVLFAILCIRRLLVGGLKAEITAIVTNGTHDKDEWVRLISRMLQEYPNSLTIDLNIEQYIPEKAKIGLRDLSFRIRKSGIKFYPVEYAFTDREICESFSTVVSSINAPTLHFNLRSENSSNHDRQLKLNNLQLLPSPNLTSPTNSNGFNLDSQLNRGQSQGPSARSNTTPSLFIPKRRPSQLSLPIPRPSIPPLQRPGPISTGSSNTSPALKSPEIKISQRKKYQKPTRIQMIDISTGTSIIKNQEESRRQTQLEEQHQKELKRQERARKAEERRREEDERKQQREREKAEKARQREEAKQAKEREKKERASRSNSISESQVSSGRKKKKINEEETIEEETIVISDGELPHKPSQVALVSPSSPTSTTKLPTNVEQNREEHEQRSQENLSPTNGPNPEVTSETTIHTPASIPSEQPPNYNENYEEIPAREMSQKDRRLFYCNCNAVLSQANQVEKNPELRQIIINFLGGVHELKELMDVSSGVSSPEDALRHIVLHEQTVRSPEGKAIKETFLFEMNINDGKWRKLKRRKTRGFKEKKNQEAEEGENQEEFEGENNENGEENNRELEE